jgi:hypothetical protein
VLLFLGLARRSPLWLAISRVSFATYSLMIIITNTHGIMSYPKKNSNLGYTYRTLNKLSDFDICTKLSNISLKFLLISYDKLILV